MRRELRGRNPTVRPMVERLIREPRAAGVGHGSEIRAPQYRTSPVSVRPACCAAASPVARRPAARR